MSDLEIRRVLVLSTAHLKQGTCEAAEFCKNFIGNFTDGCYFYVGDVGSVSMTEDPEDYPPDLYACLFFAAQQRCDEVKFDADGELVKGLTVYDW
jgi:hypothetical protein